MRSKPGQERAERRAVMVRLCTLLLLVVASRVATAQQHPFAPAVNDSNATASPGSVRPPAPTMQQNVSQWSPSHDAAPTAQSNESPYLRIPVQQSPGRERIELDVHDGLVSLVAHDAMMQDVLSAIADSQNVNIVCAANNNAPISITLREVPLVEALTAIVSICGCTWTQLGNIVHVTDLQAESLAPDVQGKQIQVFPLDYVAGDDLSQAIKTMLSPVGNAYVTATQPDDSRRSQESIVVEDLPRYLGRVAQYVYQMDRPPRQVMIQVHVLQVDLEKGCRHGVDFTHTMNFAGNTFKLQMQGFANASVPQAFFAQLTASNLLGLLEAVKEYEDTKTLASPKVMGINGQLSRIQIGERLGYRVLSNTQTATLEQVEFLDVGVVLEVTPTISRDDRVMLKINPKVSSGQVVEDTGLPNEKTSEVSTNVLLRDGQGVVIGGLIQEEEFDRTSKLWFLGDLYIVGGLFQRRVITKKRKEVIFFILPHIVDECGPCDPVEAIDHQRVQTRLFHGPLHSNYRPYDPVYPSCVDRPEGHPRLQQIHDHIFRPEGDCGYPYSAPGMVEPIHPGQPFLTPEGPVMPAPPNQVPPDGVPPNQRPPEAGPNIEAQPLPDPGAILRDVRNAPRPLIFRLASPHHEMTRLPDVELESAVIHR